MTASFDNSDVQRLIAGLENFDDDARVNLKKAGTVTAHRTRDHARALARADLGGGSARYYPNAIGYETFDLVKSLRWEIGPDKARTQGALGNILEYGSRKNAPFGHLASALEANEEDFVHGIELAAAQTLADALR